MQRLQLALWALAFAVGACGGAPVDAAPPASAPSAATPAPVTTPRGAAVPPTVTINGIAVSAKDDHFTRVTFTFKNPGAVPCKITSYTLRWSGGTKIIPLDNFVVAPGASEVRAIRVHASDGNITTLIEPADATVDLESECK